jgi:hypothetical protein
MGAVTQVFLNSLLKRDLFPMTLGETRDTSISGDHVCRTTVLSLIRFIYFLTIVCISQPYLACSAESTEGFCKHVDTSCSAINTCKTCDTFGGMVSFKIPYLHPSVLMLLGQ